MEDEDGQLYNKLGGRERELEMMNLNKFEYTQKSGEISKIKFPFFFQ